MLVIINYSGISQLQNCLNLVNLTRLYLTVKYRLHAVESTIFTRCNVHSVRHGVCLNIAYRWLVRAGHVGIGQDSRKSNVIYSGIAHDIAWLEMVTFLRGQDELKRSRLGNIKCNAVHDSIGRTLDVTPKLKSNSVQWMCFPCNKRKGLM